MYECTLSDLSVCTQSYKLKKYDVGLWKNVFKWQQITLDSVQCPRDYLPLVILVHVCPLSVPINEDKTNNLHLTHTASPTLLLTDAPLKRGGNFAHSCQASSQSNQIAFLPSANHVPLVPQPHSLLLLLFLLLEILIVVDKPHGQSGRNCRCVHSCGKIYITKQYSTRGDNFIEPEIDRFGFILSKWLKQTIYYICLLWEILLLFFLSQSWQIPVLLYPPC